MWAHIAARVVNKYRTSRYNELAQVE